MLLINVETPNPCSWTPSQQDSKHSLGCHEISFCFKPMSPWYLSHFECGHFTLAQLHWELEDWASAQYYNFWRKIHTPILCICVYLSVVFASTMSSKIEENNMLWLEDLNFATIWFFSILLQHIMMLASSYTRSSKINVDKSGSKCPWHQRW